MVTLYAEVLQMGIILLIASPHGRLATGATNCASHAASKPIGAAAFMSMVRDQNHVRQTVIGIFCQSPQNRRAQRWIAIKRL